MNKAKILCFIFCASPLFNAWAQTDTAKEVVPSIMLDAVVTIGYGSTTKKEITGSVASLKAEELNVGTFSNAAGMLQGKVAGLSVVNPNGGDPNSNYEILLRGMNTLSAGQGPLIIIDGVAGGDMRNINFQEVESIDVLKDGSAAAIYGTRGTNGVILVTTKRAKSGKTQVEYDGQITIQTVTRRAKPLSAKEFEWAVNNFLPDTVRRNYLYGSETDWFNEITNKTPISHKHSFSIAGGTKVFSHRTVLNVEQNKGLQKGNNADKYLFKTNIHQSVLDGWLDLDYNATLSKRKYSPANYDAFRQAFIHNPTEPIYDKNNSKYGGYHTVEAMDYMNPVAMINEQDAQNQSDYMDFNGRATLNIVPVEGLKWDNMISYKQERYEGRLYRTTKNPSGSIVQLGEAAISNDYNWDLQWESTLLYNRHFGKHSVNALLGYSFLEGGSQGSSMTNNGFDFDTWLTNNIGAGQALQTGHAGMLSYKESNRLISFFGRAMYNYNERYLISLSLRRDGSSRFGANHKWGWFPAASIGWRINREAFMKDVDWVSDLKLRAGYGVTGNQDFGNYRSLIIMANDGFIYSNGKWVNIYREDQNPNPDLRWEKKSEWNVGIDFAFFNERLSGSVDYYNRTVSDLLYWYEVPVPPYLKDELFTNVGSLQNSGVEVTITGIPVKNKNFTWYSTATIAHNKNKLLSYTNDQFKKAEGEVGWLNTPMGAYAQRLLEGSSLGMFCALVWEGVGADGQDIYKDDIIWEQIGCAYPKVTLGWSNTFNFYGFDLNIMLRASIGGKAFNSYRAYYENITSLGLTNVLDSWLDNTDFTGAPKYSSKYIEDASFLKIDNISLGYTFNIDRKMLKNIRLYFSAQNVLCLTKYKGIDPEVSLSGLAPGIESTSYYPRTALFTLGTHIIF